MDENIVNAENQSQQSLDVDIDALSDMQVEGDVTNSQTSDVHTQDENQSQIEIDEKFKELSPEEGRFRTLKSHHDSLDARYNKLVKDSDERGQVADLFDQMLTDEGLFMAFVNEVKPDLLKGRDATQQMKQQLGEEFGEDFKPSLTREEAERDDPFGNDSKYYMKLDSLRKELAGANGTMPTTVKEYLAKKRELEDTESRKYEVERETVKNQFKMSDTEVKAVSDWAIALKFQDLVKVHRFLRKFPTRNPDITAAPGDAQGTKSARQKFIDGVF